VSLDTDVFELRPFEKVALPQSDKGKRIKQRDYLPHGKLPVVDQGQSDIGGYTDDEALCFSGSLPVVIFGDHTRAVKLINHAFAVGADGIKIFSPAADVLPKYLYYWMKSAPIENRGYGRHYQYLRKLNVPVPSLAKQQAIVDEIEKQFSRLDEAVANLQRVKANLKRYKASVLKAAVEGRLVETEASIAQREGRSYETGEQLLQRILECRPSAWKGKYDSPTPPVCPDAALTPDGWTWITVSQAMRERIVNGLSIKESAAPTSVRALKLSAMSDRGLDFDDFRWLPIEPSQVEDIVIRESDFFVSRGNGSLELVGRGSPAQAPKQAVIFPDTMMRIRFSLVVNVGLWFHTLWTTRLVRSQIEKRVKTTAGIYKMAQPELASVSVPLPPLAEQARIVAEVERQLSIIREVEPEVDASLKRAQALRHATLAKSLYNP
jgi:type I restriction enzyme S subunit